LAALAAGPQRKIAFERGDNVWVTDLDGIAGKKIAKGSWPDISPDATRLAFNTNEQSARQIGRPLPPPIRHVAVADIESGKVTIFKNTPSDNCFGPVWSPDGTKLAFQILVNDEWHLGWINANGTDFHLLKDIKPRMDNLARPIDTVWAPAWARDSRSIFCHDFHKLYRIDLNGNVLEKWDLSEHKDKGNLSSDSRLSVSCDGTKLLVSLRVEQTGKGLWVYQYGVFSFDSGTNRMTRVSGRADSVWDACWLTRNEFLCSVQKEHKEQGGIYRMSTDGKNLKRVIKNARFPSVSAP
jgi:TolB protein